ncbi:Rha family transcriptional regulator [Clostridium sp. LBM24168]
MRKGYLLTGDGLSLVMMQFTVNKAINWKLKYFKAFNQIDEEKEILCSNFISWYYFWIV